ncbi:MAG: tRNA uridine-5-carboxymethylaminomethyl(34) synthesis GTPase MnmE [Desulfuromonadales bacterium]|nr:tRNA uridine-5-carboxymethylaminomethyl(34) synthesis GTPase MnmE [Desulfuromonadales bacterium]
MYLEDTIAAIATPVGCGGIGIIRVSGSDASIIASSVFVKQGNGGLDSHRFYYGRIVDPLDGSLIDEGMAVLMSAPRSYTREDVLELHCHGGYLIVQRVLDACLRAGARLSEAGEFTRRAFLNGRIDLCQAESIIDLINSRTDMSLAFAQSQREGLLSARLKEITDSLRNALALIEAFIDFPEEDLDETALNRIDSLVQSAHNSLGELLESFAHGKVIRDGISVLLAGKPNVGKSSLLNALTLEQRAIVSHIPGTTRDVIEEIINIDGLPVRIIDSAGIRESRDEIEQEGIRRSLEKLALADLVLFLVDGSAPLDTNDRDLLQAISGKQFVTVVNKSDLPSVVGDNELPGQTEIVHISSKIGSGIDQLRNVIFKKFVSDGVMSSRDHVAVTTVRHRDILVRALAGLAGFCSRLSSGVSGELLAIDLRDSLSAIGEITGETTPDTILDIIFSSFCIGK